MTSDLLRAALHVHQYRLSAVQSSLRDFVGTKAVLFVYYVGEYATHDVRYIISCKVIHSAATTDHA